MKKYLLIALIISLMCFGTACKMVKENKIQSKEKIEQKEAKEYNILDFYMIDKNNGWAIAKEGVLTTENGGKLWRTVTPKDNYLIQNLSYFKNNEDSIYKFLDKNTAFIAYRQNNNINIYRTTDRGKSWENSTLALKEFSVKKNYRIHAKVLDKDNGFVMITAMEGKDYSEYYLYKTIDGAKSWTKVFRNSIPMDMESSSVGKDRIKDITGIEFKDKALGWYTVKSNLAYPILFETEDGGGSWNEQKLNIPKEYENNIGYSCSTYPPIFTRDGKRAYLPVEFNNGKNSIIIFYKSIDKGTNWIPTVPIEMKQSIEIVYGIDDNGILWMKDSSENKIYRLENDDKDLLEIKSDMELKSKKIQFLNSTNGFMLIDNKLYTTKDKGISWKALK